MDQVHDLLQAAVQNLRGSFNANAGGWASLLTASTDVDDQSAFTYAIFAVKPIVVEVSPRINRDRKRAFLV